MTKAKTAEKSEVAPTPQGGEVAVYDAPEGAGFENVGVDDLVLPRLNVLQALSPQVAEKQGEGGLEGASSGMLHNSVTNELHSGDSGVVFIPAYTTHIFTEWVPRKRGGGFVGIHAVDSDVVAKAKTDKPKDTKFGRFSTDYSKNDDGSFQGNELVETFEVYGVLLREEGPIPAVLTITSTKIKVYRNWMMSLKAFRPKQNIPLFAHRVLITTVSQKHSEGSSYNIELRPAFVNDDGQRTLTASLLTPGTPAGEGEEYGHDELLKLGREIYEMAKAGKARAGYETGEAEGGSGGGGGGTDDGDAPF